MKKSRSAQNPAFTSVLVALKALLDDFGCPWMLIGGVAAALLGKPRFTADVDAVVEIGNEEIPKFFKKAENHNLIPRLSKADAFALKNRVILLKHLPSGIGVDISLGSLPFEIDAIKHSKPCKIGDLSLQLPKVEDLIIFKSVAHRPQDMLDIQEIIKLHPKIDKRYLQRHLKEFAGILDNSTIWTDVKKLLSR